ncbi:unnamed protein product [Schistosoma mattheei]|uniref:Uncharacterized protein n=1 Tax=Schistosoma mattheei TaxID=31246 RepID=A0A3P8JXJ1_9TREM|nr:unnamed protein product [Schistosoma mattheei]
MSSSSLISFKRASLTTLRVIWRITSAALYLKPSTSERRNN